MEPIDHGAGFTMRESHFLLGLLKSSRTVLKTGFLGPFLIPKPLPLCESRRALTTESNREMVQGIQPRAELA